MIPMSDTSMPDEEWMYDDETCQECDDGMILICPDDMCRGCGGCGDYMRPGCYAVCSCQKEYVEQ